MLQWLAHHGYEDLARNAICGHLGQSGSLLPRRQRRHRGAPLRDLPPVDRRAHDRGVADGDLVTLDVPKAETRRAYKEIAAAIVDGYR